MPNLKQFADYNDQQSMGSRFRQKRFVRFLKIFPEFETKEGLKILDVGGTPKFWEGIPHVEKHHITLLNLSEYAIVSKNISSIAGDACHMPQFADKSFDIVFSNSVIEHVGEFDRQLEMAKEVRRIGKRYWIQTPNFWFPIEQHLLLPFLHWFPMKLRAAFLYLVRRRKYANFKDALERVKGITLLKKKQIKYLFPDSKLLPEKFYGLNKSFTAHK